MSMMKALLGLLFLIPLALLADEVTVGVCRYPDGVYQFSYTGDVDSYGFENALTYDLDKLTATGDGVRFYVVADGITQSVYGYPDVKRCPEVPVWHPGAVSILLPASGPGPYLIEIQDTYGHWSLVTDQDHPDGIVLYNKGGFVELIGSPDQDTNPEHYRLVE